MSAPRPDAEDVFVDVAEQLETLPVTVARLLAEHQPDGQGRCQACTTGGRGTPSAPWPCGPYSVAKRADDAARADAAHDAEVAAFDAARRAAGA